MFLGGLKASSIKAKTSSLLAVVVSICSNLFKIFRTFCAINSINSSLDNFFMI